MANPESTRHLRHLVELAAITMRASTGGVVDGEAAARAAVILRGHELRAEATGVLCPTLRLGRSRVVPAGPRARVELPPAA